MSSSTDGAPAAQAPEREQWSGQVGFLFAAIGSAIGLGNIWRFPGVAYSNGGGAFMIPYIVALLCVGIPVLLLDYALGHRMRGSSPAVFRRLHRRFEWLGWWQVFVCFIIMCYYPAVVAWSMRYVLFSVGTAWGDDAKGFFYDYVGTSRVSGDAPHYTLQLVSGVIIPLLIVWGFGIYTVSRGVSRGVERANRVFLPLLVVLFLALVVRAVLLPGATNGLNSLFTPQWEALTDFKVWMAAFAQIFFSLSVGFGIMLTYASYLRPRSNLVGTGLVAAFANSSFEILAGIGVFGTLGFMAHAQGIGVDGIEGIAGPALAFITFPTVISQMTGGVIFGILFFSSLVMAGLTSFISILQVVVPAIAEKTGASIPRTALVVCLPAAALSLLLFGTTSGLFDLDIVDAFINNIGVVSSAIIMCVGVTWVLRRATPLQRHLNLVSETRVVGVWWRFLVAVVVPLALTYILVQTVRSYIQDGYEGYSHAMLGAFGWGMLALGVVIGIVLTLAKWRTPVDEFTPIDLDAPLAAIEEEN